jgi:hypothetical protein
VASGRKRSNDPPVDAARPSSFDALPWAMSHERALKSGRPRRHVGSYRYLVADDLVEITNDSSQTVIALRLAPGGRSASSPRWLTRSRKPRGTRTQTRGSAPCTRRPAGRFRHAELGRGASAARHQRHMVPAKAAPPPRLGKTRPVRQRGPRRRASYRRQ